MASFLGAGFLFQISILLNNNFYVINVSLMNTYIYIDRDRHKEEFEANVVMFGGGGSSY